MSAVVPVLAAVERDGFKLRAYAASARRPALPLLSAADLARAIMPTRDDEVGFLAGLGCSGVADGVHTVLSEDGPTLAIVHGAAFLLVTLFDDMAIAPDRTARGAALLADAALEGTLAATRGLPSARRRAWMWRAWRRDRARFSCWLRRARTDPGVEARDG